MMLIFLGLATVLLVGAIVALGLLLGCLAVILVIVVVLVRNWAPDRPVESLLARWAPPPSLLVKLDGMEVHVRDEGPRDDPTPIVLLHGTGSSLHAWDGWTARLTDHHRVVRFDRPGFGLTGPDPTGDYTMAHAVSFVARLLSVLGVDRCVVVGSSSGGRVAWHLALADPGRVAALVLIGSAGYPRTTPYPLGFRVAQSRLARAVTAYLLPEWLVAASVRGAYGDPARVTPELVRRNYEITLRAGNRRALAATLRQGAEGDDPAAIRRIATPTLILWGDRDSVVPLAVADRFRADIAGSRLVVLAGLGHMPYEEDPDSTVAPLREFLALVRPETPGP